MFLDKRLFLNFLSVIFQSHDNNFTDILRSSYSKFKNLNIIWAHVLICIFRWRFWIYSTNHTHKSS